VNELLCQAQVQLEEELLVQVQEALISKVMKLLELEHFEDFGNQTTDKVEELVLEQSSVAVLNKTISD
jgi:hypothetical protein